MRATRPGGVAVIGARCSDGCVGDEEESLQPARPLLPRRIRLAVLLLVVLIVAALIAFRFWPGSTHPSAVLPPALQTTTTPRTWPSAPGACNDNVPLPIVSSTPSTGHTGITVLLGGQRLRTADFDSGQVTAIPQARLRPGEFVVDLPRASQTYAVVTTCRFAPVRVLRIGTEHSISSITLGGSIDSVLVDGPHAWGLSGPNDDSSSGYLVPVEGGSRVRLPAGLSSNLITDGVIVGDAASRTGTSSLLLVDAASGHIRDNLGDGQPVAVGHGVVVWTVGCDVSSDKPCTLHRRSVAGGATSSYRLPRPLCCGVVSPDGRLVAFSLERATQDPRYQTGHPLPPSDVAILHLDTGRLEIVPSIELFAVTPLAAPGLAFSADSHWLVVALDAGSKTRLLAWHSGLAHPYESKPIPGQNLGNPPPVVVLPLRPKR